MMWVFLTRETMFVWQVSRQDKTHSGRTPDCLQ